MRIAVCDDDEREISHIGNLIAEYQKSREKSVEYRCFTNSTEFLCELRGGEYDLVLLDVLMPGAGGIQVAQEIRELDRNVRLIFVSASPEFAADSYSVGAYYYLLKPVDADSFFTLLDKIRGELSTQAEQGFILRSREEIVWIAFAGLMYAEVINKTVYFHLAEGVVREAAAALADFEGMLLARPEFLKTHRSYLVNLGYMQAVESNCVVMKNGNRLPVSRKRHRQVQDTYIRFLHQAEDGDGASAAENPERPDVPWQILLVDDEPAERTVWTDILKKHGCRVRTAENGEVALRLAVEEPCDCVLLDVMIPGEDGFSICERLRKIMDTPVIFLSSLTETDKQLEGFAAGGIDYITKDTPAELFWAKVETRIRLAKSERAQRRYGPLLLELKERRVLLNEKELFLTPIEFDILCRLSERAGHIFTPEDIYGMIWSGQPWDGGQLVQRHMSRLRRKLEKAWEEHHFIEAVWGQGYRFVPVKQ